MQEKLTEDMDPSIDCSSNGEGGPHANNVYEIQNGKY